MLLRGNGWSADELFSLWQSDPQQAFASALHRILADSNPPLYPIALFIVRQLPVEPRSSILITNGLAVLIGVFAVLMSARPAGLQRFAAVVCVALVFSGPVLRYMPEGRSYLMALMLVFVASWLGAVAVEDEGRRASWWGFAAVGCLAALCHVYAGLFCCCLAAGLMVASWRRRRWRLCRAGLALGLSSGSTLVAWYLWFGMHAAVNVLWLTFSVSSIGDVLLRYQSTAYGFVAIVAVFAALLAASLFVRPTREMSIVLCVCLALFFLIPIAISLKTPIISARYWIIGTPVIIVFLSFWARAAWAAGQARPRPARLAVGIGAAVFLVLADAGGFLQAQASMSQKLVWRGAPTVAPLLAGCPDASVHVNSPAGMDDDLAALSFGFVAHAPRGVFVSARSPATGFSDASRPGCPVLGWAEHVGPMDGQTDGDRLRLLKINAAPAEVAILRHHGGYVVLQRSAAADR